MIYENKELNTNEVIMLIARNKLKPPVLWQPYAPKGFVFWQQWQGYETHTIAITDKIDIYYNSSQDKYFITSRLKSKEVATVMIIDEFSNMQVNGPNIEKIADYFTKGKVIFNDSKAYNSFSIIYGTIFKNFADIWLPFYYIPPYDAGTRVKTNSYNDYVYIYKRDASNFTGFWTEYKSYYWTPEKSFNVSLAWAKRGSNRITLRDEVLATFENATDYGENVFLHCYEIYEDSEPEDPENKK